MRGLIQDFDRWRGRNSRGGVVIGSGVPCTLKTRSRSVSLAAVLRLQSRSADPGKQ